MESQLFLTEEGESKASIFFTLMMAFFVVTVSALLLRSLEMTLLTATTARTEVGQEAGPEMSPAPSIYDYLAQVGHSLLGLETAYGKTVEPDFAAEKYSKIKEIGMAPGERREIKIGFYNRGRYNWRQSGASFVSLYTDKPHYRSSVFWDKFWFQKDQPAKLKDALVGPGQRGYFEFYLQAPQKEGVYQEFFALAAENKIWISGGQFDLVITVKAAAGEEIKASPAPVPEYKVPVRLELKQLDSRDFQARQLSRLEPIFLKSGETTTFQLMFINQGKKPWPERKLILRETRLGVARYTANFAAADWLDAETVLVRSETVVQPGQTEIYTISLQAPLTEERRVFNLYFNLLVNQQLLKGGEVQVPLVVNDAARQGLLEPSIRVGLYTTEEPVVFTSPFAYKIKTSEGEELGLVNPGEEVKIVLDEASGTYAIQQPAGSLAVNPGDLLFEPVGPDSYFILANHENRPRWNKNFNDNKFRGALKLRFNRQTGYLWVINELSSESYLKGLAEVAENSPRESQKAVAVAARSFALAQMREGGKHLADGFDVDAAVDQVYRGYGQEERSPHWRAGVEATSGLVLTYDGQIIATPYFARSNGRTRTWKEVWGGQDKPWLKSVKTPYDRGYARLGHGVGISLHDAQGRAKKGWLYEEILKYYYQGVEMMKVY